MSGQESKNTLYDNAIGWGLLLIVLAVVCWVIWYFNDVLIRDIIRWIRYGEMWLISWFVDQNYTIFFNGKPVNWHATWDSIPQWDKYSLKEIHLHFLTMLVVQPSKYFFSVVFGLGGLWCLFYGPQTHNRQELGIEGLIKRQAKNFPVITPFVEFDPSKQPPRPPGSPVPAELPLFAEALGPEEWLSYNHIPVPDGKIDEEALSRAFKKQLIGRWKGAKALKPYQQVLLAAFCLKASRKRVQADDILSRLAHCWGFKSGMKIDRKLLKEAQAILRNKNLSERVLSAANQHAFVTTALLRALATAREEGGVLAPAQFVWLRAHDRVLWYPLNNLGRQSFHTEALGAVSHYRVEKMTQRPVPVPKVEDAVKTITAYMASGKARPIPQMDYTDSKKRGVKKAR